MFGLYVHWPYCARKCPYCDFNSHVRPDRDEDAWCEAVSKEMALIATLQGEERPTLETIFFGGGTPSLMAGRTVGRIVERAAELWTVAKDIEITLEANPASAEAARFADYRAAGVNRLSLGIQSFEPAALKFLGRLHDVEEAKAALTLAISIFPRVSFDLIYARPGQEAADWKRELAEALNYGTDHLSLYQLTIEPTTPFATMAQRGAFALPPEEQAAALFELTREMTERAGMPAYEISNHAKPGGECRHNLIYWRYGAYAGVGPGAHGRLDLYGKRFATAAERQPERWLAKIDEKNSGFSTIEEIEPAEAAREQLLMGLRLREGIDRSVFRGRWNIELSAEKIAALSGLGLVRLEGERLAATDKGKLVLNRIIEELADF
jgi:putative oxygen-independent coproporphyrinogen III oxidase